MLGHNDDGEIRGHTHCFHRDNFFLILVFFSDKACYFAEKRYICKMKKVSGLLFLMVCVLDACLLSARSVSADKALESALLELTSLTQTNANVADLKLVDSREYNGAKTLYVFSSPAMYVIASADDDFPGLIAYSFEGGFSEDMSPSMQWLICQYSESIGISGGANVAHSRSYNADRSPVSPMLSTKWGQAEPFNSLCPLHDGVRPVTGCVATAIAQIMRFYSYPDRGLGTIQWTCARDGYNHDHSYDFEAVAFDWNNMADVYSSNSTEPEQRAVAELMAACGAAAEMQYTPYASGSHVYLAGKGLIDYLRYDRGLEYLESKWFTGDEWDDMCYQELAQGRPILYGGENDVWHSRHAFVMDGYSEEGLYHINWGWEGKNDGYFKLSDFSFEGGNYRINHTMVRGIRPALDDSEFIPSFAFEEMFRTDKSQYEKIPGTTVWFMQGIRNVSMTDFWIQQGVRCVPTDGSAEFYLIANRPDWYRFRALKRFYEIPAVDFPVGTYDVYPVFKTETLDWRPIYQNLDRKGDGVRFEVTETAISLQSAGVQDVFSESGNDVVYYNLNGIRVENPTCGVFIKVSDGKATLVRL